MPRYLISYPSAAMQLTPEEYPAVAAAAHAVVQEIQDAGVYIFTGGLDDSVDPVLVGGDGSVSDTTYPQSRGLNGGMMVIDVETRDEALRWASKIALACGCAQEVRQFAYDPAA